LKRARFVVLGSGAASPAPERALPAHYFEYEGVGALLDCGEGTQFQLMKAKISFSRIKVVFVSHLHGDHVLGLPGLLQTMAMASRRDELLVIGPKGLKDFLLSSFELTYFYPPYPIKVVEVLRDAEITYRNLKLKVFPVNHTVPAFGVSVETASKRKVRADVLEREGLPKRLWGRLQRGEDVVWEGRVFKYEDFTFEGERIKVVYSGDTAPCERLVEEAEGADLLVHEATFTKELKEEAHDRGHSTAEDAATAAARAGVKQLLMVHFSARYKDLRRHLEEARRVFPRSYAAEDLTKVVILK